MYAKEYPAFFDAYFWVIVISNSKKFKDKDKKALNTLLIRFNLKHFNPSAPSKSN